MSGTPDWLPPLVLFRDFGGDWGAYLEVVYAWFRRDFLDSRPIFQGRRLGLKRHPMTYGKEATFWHELGKPLPDLWISYDSLGVLRFAWCRGPGTNVNPAVIRHPPAISFPAWRLKSQPHAWEMAYGCFQKPGRRV